MEDPNIVKRLFALLVYGAGFFIIPFVAKRFSGVLGNLTGMVNDRTKGFLDRTKNASSEYAKTRRGRLKTSRRAERLSSIHNAGVPENLSRLRRARLWTQRSQEAISKKGEQMKAGDSLLSPLSEEEGRISKLLRKSEVGRRISKEARAVITQADFERLKPIMENTTGDDLLTITQTSGSQTARIVAAKQLATNVDFENLARVDKKLLKEPRVTSELYEKGIVKMAPHLIKGLQGFRDSLSTQSSKDLHTSSIEWLENYTPTRDELPIYNESVVELQKCLDYLGEGMNPYSGVNKSQQDRIRRLKTKGRR